MSPMTEAVNRKIARPSTLLANLHIGLWSDFRPIRQFTLAEAWPSGHPSDDHIANGMPLGISRILQLKILSNFTFLQIPRF